MKYSYEIPIKIESDLSLKILKESDSQQLFTLVDQNRSYLMEFLPWLNTTQRPTDSESFIKSVEKSNQLGKTLVLAIFKGSKIIGMAGFNSIDSTNKVGKIGYWLSKGEQGQGIITKSCNKLLSIGFEELSLNKIEIRCATTNKKSKKIPESLHFTLEGTLREVEWLYDCFVDHDIYSLLKREWNP